MNKSVKIRAAYLRAHEGETFNICLTGNVRAIIQDRQTTNAALYSGNPVELVGGAEAYWKAESQ